MSALCPIKLINVDKAIQGEERKSTLSNENINLDFYGRKWTERKVTGFYGQHTYRL
jgi:hypothetical protein